MRMPLLADVTRALSLSTLQKPILDNSPPRNEIDGGPFSFCDTSRPTDLFEISSVSISKRPVYMYVGRFEDIFTINLYGTFQKSWTGNGTLDLTVNCGSHCEEYGYPPLGPDSPNSTTTFGFCEVSKMQKPFHGKKATCPPEKGFALISSVAYIWPMFIRAPGYYNFTIDAKSDDGERIYCMRTEVCLRWEDEEKNERYPPSSYRDCKWPR